MEPFRTHTGRLALLDWTDVNTDLIIPARYLKRIERTGYGPLLFADKRYQPGAAPPADHPEQHGAEDEAFPLNAPAARDATILVVGKNFGCGSSREHAVWAVSQAGFKAVIAPGKDEGFADIFEGNAFQNGLLPIELEPADWQQIADAVRSGQAKEATIDLAKQTVTVRKASGDDAVFAFDIPEKSRERLLRGLDGIAETLQYDAAIRKHEANQPSWMTTHSA